jgi:hypothetical protein
MSSHPLIKKKSHFRGNLLEKFDAVHNDSTCEFNNKATCIQNCLRNGLCSLDTTVAILWIVVLVQG